MNHSRDSLKEFLAGHASVPDAVPAIMRDLEPLYAHADGGRYLLARGNDLGLESIAAAITTAAGRNCMNVSLALMSRLGHLTINDEAELWRKLMSDRGDTLGDCLRHEHRTALQERLKGDDPRERISLSTRLWECLEKDLWLGLDAAVAAITCHCAPRQVIAAIADSIRTVVFFFTGFAMAGDGKRTAQLSALVQLIPKAIPLHAGLREPQRWHVLAY